MKKGHLLVGLQFALLFALAASPTSKVSNNQQIIGFVLSISGIVGILISMRQLGKALTAMPEPKKEAPFVTSGLYKIVRHPIYSFLLTLTFGVVLVKGSISAIFIFLSLCVLLRYKYGYEDQVLREKWAEASRYQERVPALLPRFRRSA